LVLYAKRFEDLPIVQKVGDVIRVHRALLRLYNHQRQFNASVFYNSSWALFSADSNDSQPYQHSGKAFHFEKHESALLQNSKKWAHQYVSNYNVITNDMYVALNKVSNEKGDFDCLAKIAHIHELDEYTNELRLRDASGQTYYTLALKLKFPNLHQNDIVRVRSATVDETSTHKKVLNLSHYSNILTLPSHSKLAKELKGKITDEKAGDKAALKQKVQYNAVVLTEVDKKHQHLANTPLNELFHSADSDPELSKESTFRTTFSVVKIEPVDVKEWTKAYDKKTKKATSLKGTSTGKAAGNLIYQVQFLVKDASTQLNNNTYRILLYTHDGLGANFFGGHAAENLHKNEGARKKLEEYEDLLTRFNSWVDCVVEKRNGFYFIKDTKIIY
jgi:Telomeric single stranded DNA binding POT1/CDC13